jgi:hypothetical protein
MSPVTLAELDPKSRALALQQIEATQGTTALATVEPHPFYTPAEMRARRILSRIDSISAKLKTLEDDIRALWLDFDNLKAGETILGCATKKEFCEKKLHRTPRAIQYMLAGGNPNNTRSEIISPIEASRPPQTPITAPSPQPITPIASAISPTEQPIIDAEFVDAPQPAPVETPEPKPERTLEDVLDKLVERIALQPYGYSAAKFKAYPEQHTTDLAVIELAKQEIWQRVVEIGQAKLNGGRS